jgi:hypothetical protein
MLRSSYVAQAAKPALLAARRRGERFFSNRARLRLVSSLGSLRHDASPACGKITLAVPSREDSYPCIDNPYLQEAFKVAQSRPAHVSHILFFHEISQEIRVPKRLLIYYHSVLRRKCRACFSLASPRKKPVRKKRSAIRCFPALRRNAAIRRLSARRDDSGGG